MEERYFAMEKNLDFLKENLIAHRGLHNNEDIPENSMLAFKKAVEKNFIIELDVHLLKDNTIVVMHDNDINRMTGKSGELKSLTYKELKELRLLNTEEKIPTIEQVLNLVDGRVPIIIELKYDTKVGMLEENLSKILDKYRGKFAVKSFDPLSVRWFKKNRPEYVRGLLIGDKYKKKYEQIASKSIFVKISKPDFISCNYNLADNKKIQKLRKNKLALAWTIKDKETYDSVKGKFDNYICENLNFGDGSKNLS